MVIIKSKKGIHILNNQRYLRPIKGLTTPSKSAIVKNNINKGAK